MILADHQIAALAEREGMITPFVAQSVKGPGGVSYGLSGHGYDIRLGDTFAVYKSRTTPLPADVDYPDLDWTFAEEFIIPAKGFALAHTLEQFCLPRNVVGLVHDKSSLARRGLNLQNTVLEAGWSGQITLEIVNHLNCPVVMYAGQGVAQVLFLSGEPAAVSYADRDGKYQHQQGVTLPKGSQP